MQEPAEVCETRLCRAASPTAPMRSRARTARRSAASSTRIDIADRPARPRYRQQPPKRPRRATTDHSRVHRQPVASAIPGASQVCVELFIYLVQSQRPVEQ